MDSSPQPPAGRTGSRPADPPDEDGSPPPDDLPACLSCRKRKSRCSRETPSCAQCLRLGCECLYVSKQKPGLKAGVVDTLSRRLEFLEKLFLDGPGNKKPHLDFLDLDIDQLRSQVTSPFTQGLLAAPGHRGSYAFAGEASGSANGGSASPVSSGGRLQPDDARSHKRRRVDNYRDDGGFSRSNGGGSGPNGTGHHTGHQGRVQYLFLDDPPYRSRRHRRRQHHPRGTEGNRGGDDIDESNDSDSAVGDDNDSHDDRDAHDQSEDDDGFASDDSSSSLDQTWIPPLPALPLLKAIVEAHFQTVHHWVPILHSTRFRAALTIPRERRRCAVLIHAIVAMSIKYVDFAAFGLTSRQVARQIRLSRHAVQLNALEGLSFINAQALIFLAFDYMGSGLITKAWPIVAALTRMTVFLQLNVEPDDVSARPKPMVQPAALFDGPRDWTEAEERRRIFWGIFFLDRISSISAGWQPSLTGSDVQRRLPCSGGFWAREESVTTPYFALWDGREGETGGKPTSSIMAAPASGAAAYHASPDYTYGNSHHAMASPATGRDGTTPSVGTGTAVAAGHFSASTANTNKQGAVAYCIEATEHLSHVMAFFARQPPPSPSLGETVTAAGAGAGVGAEDRAAMTAWLTRFKELDLRLVHWKMHLPTQWADWHSSLKIDPNLTLCHLSHLASMVLLHQHIAYPPPQWSSLIRPSLPSVCSAETCDQAVDDMVAISQKYLRYVGGLACGQFAFCLFIAARFKLVHGRIGKSALPGPTASGTTTISSTSTSSADDTPPAFFALLESLDNISVRWKGYCIPDDEDSGQVTKEENHEGAPIPKRPKRRVQPLDLAAQYAAKLRALHQKATGIGVEAGHLVSTTEELIALLSTSSMEGLIKLKTSSHTTDALLEVAASAAAQSTSTPSALSASATATSQLRSPSVIHGGGVEMANILQNPVPASAAAAAATGRTPAMTPMTGMASITSLVSPANNGPDVESMAGYGSMRGGPVSANVSNVRMMPGTPATAGSVFNMDMMTQQPPQHQQHPLHQMQSSHEDHQQHHPQQQHLQQHSQHPQHPQHPQHHQHQQHPHHPQHLQHHQQQPQQQPQQLQPHLGVDHEGEYAAMSSLFLGNQFLDMDRVLISNDTSFLLR